MNFNSIWLRSFRVLLFPISLLYGGIVLLRNFCFDKKLLKSFGFNFPLIVVGNLAMGGTGKSPLVEYLLRMLVFQYKVATLSRGYKRRTRGYILAGKQSTALDIGDEPMQFLIKFPEAAVAVGEERLAAIPQLLFERPDTQVILLDDAFQHRSVKAGLNILLTDYHNLYTRDFFLPTGDLRDSRQSAKRAEILIVTKCPSKLNEEEADKIKKELRPLPRQSVFFTTIRYGVPYHIVHKQIRRIRKQTEVLLVCGIANPDPLKKYLHEETGLYEVVYYDDHHIFSIDDLREIDKRFAQLDGEDKMILTTEKDAVRLLKYRDSLNDLPFYVLPIETVFLLDGAPRFNHLITNFIGNYADLRHDKKKE